MKSCLEGVTGPSGPIGKSIVERELEVLRGPFVHYGVKNYWWDEEILVFAL